MNRRKVAFDFILAGTIAVAGLASGLVSAYADWAGCGHPATAIMCDGCGGSVDGTCDCRSTPQGYKCTDTGYVCTVLPNGWIQCQAPGQGYDICTRVRGCKERKSCNNSQGHDGGACAPGGTCTVSDPPVIIGDERVEYYK